MARPTLLLAPVLLSLLLILSAGRTQQVAAHAAAAAAAPAPTAPLDFRGGWSEQHHQRKHAEEGGGWLSWLGFGRGRAVEEAVTPTRAKKEAAKEHAKASWWWGKSYAKDKAAEAERTVERGAARARDETAEGLEAARRKVGEQFDTVKAHAKKVAHSAQEEVKQGVDATKGAVHKVGETVAAGKRKVDQVGQVGRLVCGGVWKRPIIDSLHHFHNPQLGDAVVVLSDAKRTYDKYQRTKAAGKAKTKNFFRRAWEFVWPPARRPVCRSSTEEVVGGSELVVPAEEEIPALPRSVDEALEDFEACKDEEEAARMTAAERAKTRGLFEIAKAKITGKPPLAKEQGPQASFRERWEAEKVGGGRGCVALFVFCF